MASQRSSAVFSPGNVESNWQLVSIDNPGRTGRKQYTTMAQEVSSRHRRGHTEGTKRMSALRTRWRSNTTTVPPASYQLSPASTVEAPTPIYQIQESRPQSGWSDSDRSDGFTKSKSWVLKGSRILKKQNSKFNLSSSRTMDWVVECDEGADLPNGPLPREQKHYRMRSAGDGRFYSLFPVKANTYAGMPTRPIISKPYNFQHLTHTYAHQFQELDRTSYNDLMTEFSAIRASQAPRRELQGIRAEDLLRSPVSESSLAFEDPMTPPPASPAKPRGSRSGSLLSSRGPIKIQDLRSFDNSPLPSPKSCQMSNGPTSPPLSISSHNASISAPDFFTAYHQDSSTESHSEAGYFGHKLEPTYGQTGGLAFAPEDWDDHMFNASNLPHAITTPNDIAFTLKPNVPKIGLADVPEEDESHAQKRTSTDDHRPGTAGSLRHAKSFPNARSLVHRRNPSSSSYTSAGRRDSFPMGGPTLNDSLLPLEDRIFDEVSFFPRVSRRMSFTPKGIDACWEDDIDFCYEHEAEANCDFDWDCIAAFDQNSNEVTLSNQCNVQKPENTSKDNEESGSEYSSQNDTSDITNTRSARFETTISELEHSSSSSTKSSMASLRGPITPSQPLPSPYKRTSFTHNQKDVDGARLSSSFVVAPDYDLPWTQEDMYHNILQSDRKLDYHYPFQNIHLTDPTSRNGSPRSSYSISKCNSSESIMLSQSALSVQRRRNAESNVSLPDLVYSKTVCEGHEIATEQRNDGAIPIPSKLSTDIQSSTAIHLRQTNIGKETARHSILKKPSSNFSSYASDGQVAEGQEAPVILSSLQSRDRAGSRSSAPKMRSGSITTTTSPSSSRRTSRTSYSLFPPVTSTRSLP
ncbi:MAG: hypothetical protein LQ342_000598 [Letrouitia transgressa]|nr:MAG: hypothetical protein LQ342_000598 [Letrouitia transgressa]